VTPKIIPKNQKMLCEVNQWGSLPALWLAMSFLGFVSIMTMSGIIFNKYYANPSFESWQYKSNPKYPSCEVCKLGKFSYKNGTFNCVFPHTCTEFKECYAFYNIQTYTLSIRWFEMKLVKLSRELVSLSCHLHCPFGKKNKKQKTKSNPYLLAISPASSLYFSFMLVMTNRYSC
jgi:hypothetical protein